MKLVLSLIFALMASQAAALSCMRADIASTFGHAHASDDLYYILRGSLDFDPALMPNGVEDRTAPPAAVPATFEGMSMGRRGFKTAFSGPLVLQPSCAGPWCGSVRPSADIVVFAKQTDQGLQVDVGACPFYVFHAPTDDMEQRLVNCIAGRGCERADGF